MRALLSSGNLYCNGILKKDGLGYLIFSVNQVHLPAVFQAKNMAGI
jgi:hypothetical protein